MYIFISVNPGYPINGFSFRYNMIILLHPGIWNHISILLSGQFIAALKNL